MERESEVCTRNPHFAHNIYSIDTVILVRMHCMFRAVLKAVWDRYAVCVCVKQYVVIVPV